MVRSCARIRSMLAYVHSLGWMLREMAAFSAGRPKESKPIGNMTLQPFMRR